MFIRQTVFEVDLANGGSENTQRARIEHKESDVCKEVDLYTSNYLNQHCRRRLRDCQSVEAHAHPAVRHFIRRLTARPAGPLFRPALPVRLTGPCPFNHQVQTCSKSSSTFNETMFPILYGFYLQVNPGPLSDAMIR